MKDFVKMTLAVVLGLFIAGIAMFLFSMMMLGSLAALGTSQPVMPREAILTVDMSTLVLSEQTQEADR